MVSGKASQHFYINLDVGELQQQKTFDLLLQRVEAHLSSFGELVPSVAIRFLFFAE